MFCQVCDPNADITLRSCDGTLFKFYRKQLEAYSVAFAGGEAFPSVAGEIIDLSETLEVVELLLQLMSLDKYANLMTLELEFSVLAQLAEAIEKYEVVSARIVCDMVMRFVCFSSGGFREAERTATEPPFPKAMPWRYWTGP
jgi:hypothetical protein